MSGKLLDTNAVVALQRGDPALLAFFKAGEEWFVSSTVLGELYYGAYNSGRVDDNVRVIDELASEAVILDSDRATSKLYGQIRHALKIKGRPIPENDIWIAAIALQYDLVLVTRDEHFKQVDGLSLETWQVCPRCK